MSKRRWNKKALIIIAKNKHFLRTIYMIIAVKDYQQSAALNFFQDELKGIQSFKEINESNFLGNQKLFIGLS